MLWLLFLQTMIIVFFLDFCWAFSGLSVSQLKPAGVQRVYFLFAVVP
jgi:hypothetical protein